MNLILSSIAVFLVIILVLVAILLIAKTYLSPSGNVTVTINGMTRTFQQLPVNKDSADYVHEQTIVAMTRDAMNAELNALKNESLSAIQRGRDEEARLPVWDKLIMQLNPEVAEKQRHEQEITSLKTQIATMASDNAELKSMMARILAKMDGESEGNNKK